MSCSVSRTACGLPGSPPSNDRSIAVGGSACCGETGLEVGDDVGNRLKPHRQTNKAWGHITRCLLFGSQLAVRGAGRVNDQRTDITNIGHVAVQAQPFNETLTRFEATLDLECEDRAVAAAITEACGALKPVACARRTPR